MRIILALLGGFMAIAGVTGAAAAATFHAAGLDFSDELGGFNLISVTGVGTVIDPIVIVEEISGLQPAVLVVRGAHKQREDDRKISGLSFINIAVIKIVINRSGRVWTGFDLELQEEYQQPSTYGDGLSFDQMRSFGDEMSRSDLFELSQEVSEPFDRVSFGQGSVDPGATVRFNFFITDPTPQQEFFLVQEPKLILSHVPPGARQLALRPPL